MSGRNAATWVQIQQPEGDETLLSPVAILLGSEPALNLGLSFNSLLEASDEHPTLTVLWH